MKTAYTRRIWIDYRYAPSGKPKEKDASASFFMTHLDGTAAPTVETPGRKTLQSCPPVGAGVRPRKTDASASRRNRRSHSGNPELKDSSVLPPVGAGVRPRKIDASASLTEPSLPQWKHRAESFRFFAFRNSRLATRNFPLQSGSQCRQRLQKKGRRSAPGISCRMLRSLKTHTSR